jgi:hypothetical protein
MVIDGTRLPIAAPTPAGGGGRVMLKEYRMQIALEQIIMEFERIHGKKAHTLDFIVEIARQGLGHKPRPPYGDVLRLAKPRRES